MKRPEALKEYKWDFDYLYKNQEEWKKDLDYLVEISKEFKDFKNRLHEKEVFFKCLDLEEKIDFISNKLSTYTRMGDTDQADEVYRTLEALLMNVLQDISIQTSFISPETKKIGFETISKWLKETNGYDRYLYGYEKFFEQAKHILSEHDEELLSKISKGNSAIDNMYDTLAYADRQEETINYKGVNQVLTNSLYQEILQDSDPINDQELRLKAGEIFSKNFTSKKHSFALIYEGILQADNQDNELRNYESSLQASLSSDSIPVDIYLKLLEVGKKYIKPLEDFLLLTKKHFKLDKFYPSDRQLKLVKEYNQTFTVEQAKDHIRNALSVLGDEYLKNLEISWGPNKIDYYEDTNKRDGAYSTGGHGVDPIILMNWDDKLNSVNTLAHECGHSVHTLFSEQNQVYPLSQYPIILAEVASTVNEHILFDYMYKNAKLKEEKIYLLQHRIFDLVSTFYRQIQFADFEYRASLLVSKQTPLTSEVLRDLFREVEDDYGYKVFDKLEKENQTGYGWPRISHFFHSPFYVYKYAIDVTASYKLYDDIKKGNIKTTLDFLKAGGSKEPLQIMLDAGIDFNKEETYLPLINGIKDHIKELEELLNK
ncbi:oligoendopeptidase F [Mycoplasma feriruminatoris]|uniref:oligoendopeptidase F n=1 Tax=Mycoplasma feriruminatoris TaxID=1179777 RepID=UPI00241EFCF0|nr:oligoendopeptidase F [Mycoplasma feriruminatoris]WFQ90410.1 Oligoendopeptidase F, plasmid [Mycoplasma feriruminatoris]